SSSEMREAFKDFRLVLPQIEYRDRMSLNVGERTLELYYLKNVHSEADTAIWLPRERVLFTAASVGVKRFGNHRPLVSIPDTLSAIRMMKALNPEVVIPGHGKNPRRYGTLLQRADGRRAPDGQAGKVAGRDQKGIENPRHRGLGGAGPVSQ